jgi:hypothetical protein
MFLKSSYAGTAPTNYGHQISPTSGHSFPIFGLGGVYQKGDKQVFVKPVLDEKAALAEMRSTEISRRAHGLEAPEQRIVVIKDPMDVKGVRRFLALESDLDPKFVNNQPMGLFNEEQYFRQLVASLLRVDKDLSGSNVFGNVVADAGPAGVFGRASGLRDYEKGLPSMEDQALINLLGIKGGAKRAFAESTLGMMAGITPEQYKARMLGEIQKVLPRLKETIASFKLTNSTEVGVYDDMIKRLEQGLGVDWSKFHAIHSAVKPAKPKAPTQAVPGYKNGVVSVPGPKGAGDVVAAMLSPGEAVIPAAMAKKYAPLIQGMIAGNIPGYAVGKQDFGLDSNRQLQPGSVEGSHLDTMTPSNFLTLVKQIASLGDEFAETTIRVKLVNDELAEGFETVSMTFAEIADLPEGTQIQAQGVGYAGTAMIEPAKMNQAYDVAGIAGTPTSLSGLVEAARLAEIALNSGTEETQRYAEEYRQIIAAGQRAKEALASSTSAQEELNYMLEIKEKTYSDGLQISRKETDVNKANLAASERMLQIRNQYTEDIKQGMTAEEALEKARLTAAHALITEASTTDRSGNLTLTAFAEGERREAGKIASGRRPNTGPRGAETRSVALQQYKNTAKEMGRETEEFAIDIAREAFKSFDRGLKISSPSGKFEELANNVSAGVDLAKDDAKMAGEELAKATTNAVAKTAVTRRASSDPQTQAEIDRINQQGTQASRDSANIAAGTSRKPRRVTREADSTAPTEKIWDESTKNVSNFSNKISQAAFGLSSVTGILSVFGADLSGILPVISGMSGALFGLIEISRLLQGTKLAEIASTRLLIAAQSQGAVGNVASAVASGNVGNMFKTMFVQGRGFMGFLTNIGKVAMTLLKGFGFLGLAITALTVGIPLVIKAFEDHANKINGLGAAANLTEDKLKFLGEKFGVTAKSINWAERTASAQATAGKSTEEKEQVVDLMIDPQFAEKFKTEIAGIKDATSEQANLALESLATQLRNSGFDTEAIDAIIAAIVAKTGRTDLNLRFNSILIDDANTANAAADLAKQATDSYSKAAKDAVAAAQAAAEEGVNTDNVTINLDYEAIRQDPKMLQETKAAAGVVKTSLDSLTLAFENGSISSDIYNQSLSGLFNALSSADQPAWMLDSLAEQMGLTDLVSGLSEASDKALALQAAVSGVDAKEDLEIIKEAEGSDDATVLEKARKARIRIAAAIKVQTKAQQEQNAAKALSNNLEENSLEAETLEKSIAAHHALVAAGMDAALAYKISGDAAQVAAMQKAMDTDATNGNTAAMDAFIASAQRLEGLSQQRAALNPVGGGGGQKSAFQEAMDQLKEQQQEAKSSTMAYAKLRSAGMSVAESSEIAKDSILAAALASEKVGSKKWNELVAAIRSARAEEEAWLRTTPEGRADQFDEVYGKVMDVFSSQEAVLQSNNEAAMKTTNQIIDVLEKQIDGYNRVIGSLERDLAKIADKEEEINEKYDEKTKALETVKKLNQDLINQQKSQLSIADALSRGDISAAASAMQDSRAQNAAAQGNATGNALDAARQGELDALTENGRTRADIELEIKNTKLLIEEIEFGALQNARDMVTAADEALELAIENLRVQGLSKSEWENIKVRIDSSRASANLYEAEVLQALLDARELVGEWNKLNDTYTTTHVINTIHTSSGGGGAIGAGPGPAAAADPNTTPEAWREQNSKIKDRARVMNSATPSLYSAYGIAKLLSDYNTAYTNATTGSADRQEQRIPAARTAFTALNDKLKQGGFALGGPVSGPGTGTSDSIPAMLSNGEYVVKASSAKKIGRKALDSLNAGRPPKNFSGPMIGRPNLPKPVYTKPERNYVDPNSFSRPVYNMPQNNYPITGSPPRISNNQPNNTASQAANNNSVYNYSLSVNVSGTNASANDIANVVMNKIKAIDSQQLRSQVVR